MLTRKFFVVVGMFFLIFVCQIFIEILAKKIKFRRNFGLYCWVEEFFCQLTIAKYLFIGIGPLFGQV